ncbi:MAG: class I SAM-dependent methyltransferase, partial [Rhodospirillales bacterium]|nr:class I SAM-dependent methyltransferase [Rhodospirillales bacterium]
MDDQTAGQGEGADLRAGQLPSYLAEHRRLGPASRYTAVVVGNILSGWVRFESVLDLGCGNGAWLRGLADGGRRSVLGIEPEAQDPADLQIDAEHILQADLSRPLDLHRRFDLVLCLEVAEHIDASAADTVVETCVRHGDLVLFSAAIPGQGGVHHVNEQPPEYWAEKFAAHGYAVRDLIRPLIWNDQQIPVWYRQNLLLFLRQDAPHLAGLAARNAAAETPLARVHPDLLGWLGRHSETLRQEAASLQAEIAATSRALHEAQAAAARAEAAFHAA